MAQPTNLIDRYGGTRVVREQLADIIFMVAKTDTPFTARVGRTDLDNTFFEWNTDNLNTVSTGNVVIEGDDTTLDSRGFTARVGNYAQISKRSFGVSGTQESLKKVQYKSQLAYETMKAGKELKRDMEAMLLLNQAAVVGNSTTARRTAGLPAWVRTNIVKNGSTDPTMSSTNDGYPNAARTGGTLITFTEAMLKSILSKCWVRGATGVDTIMVGPYNKTVASAFAGIATKQTIAAQDKSPMQIIASADIYVSDFGDVKIIPNAWQNEQHAHALDFDYIKLGTLRPMKREELAKTGDSTKFHILTEYGLMVTNEASIGIIADLITQ